MDPLSALARLLVLGRLRRLRQGALSLGDRGTTETFGHAAGLQAEIHVHDPRFWRAVAFGGSVGAGEAYADGWWSSPDPTTVVRLLLRNRAMLDSLETGSAALVQAARRGWHALRRNTPGGSRRNIRAHYDLGNDFFQLFLDDTLSYSCGIFPSRNASMLEASIAKFDRIIALLDLGPEDHLVEIGTGWGGFALHAARVTGCRITTTTISEAQYRHAAERIAAEGLGDRITLLQRDYRELEGQFSKLVSIEMIEAVGHEHFATYFERCAALLQPGGRAVIQAITIADAQYEAARREVDFIKRHIFPGSCIPSASILRATSSAAGLRMVGADEIGPHYAETLRRWRDRMHAERERLLSLGYDARFQRLWEFYFCYCEGGFREGAIGNLQITLVPRDSGLVAPATAPAVPGMLEAA